MLKRAASLAGTGVRMVALLALADTERRRSTTRMPPPSRRWASRHSRAPDLFPDLMAAAIGRHDLGQWASARGIAMGGGAPR
jgi:hypothetical protein